ncbi:MAG: exosome complex exonuclease Rrp41, partial [Methanothrix sp.]
EITLLQMDGRLSKEELKRALELAKAGCQQIYEIQRKVLVDRYSHLDEMRSCDEAVAEEEI